MKTLLLVLITAGTLCSQCSDAGVCSIGNHNSEQGSERNFSAGLSYNYGYSGKDDDITYNSLVFEGSYNYTPLSSVLITLPYSEQTGPLGSASGLGDLILLINQNIYNADELSLNIQGGVKLATGKEDKEGLPQAYQPGLGSNDILAGLSFNYSNFNAALGYQYAGSRNDNLLRVDRGNDFLLSTGYGYDLTEDLSGSLELLFIKRIGETSISLNDPSTNGQFINVPESDNFQVNTVLSLNYKLNDFAGIKFFGAVPLRKREVNVDGLTRAVTVSTGMYFMF